jgi:hypothetical protein
MVGRYQGGKREQPLGGAGNPQKNGRSALLGLEARVGLVDHIDPALAAHDFAVAMAALQRFQRGADFHRAANGCLGDDLSYGSAGTYRGLQSLSTSLIRVENHGGGGLLFDLRSRRRQCDCSWIGWVIYSGDRPWGGWLRD